MTECSPTSTQAAFSFFRPQQVTVTFDEGDITTEAGGLLLRQLDDRLGLTAALASALRDWRNPLFVVHPLHELVRERVFGIAQGYEDCNDAASLRDEPLFKAICRGKDDIALASQPTLSRFENRAARGGLDAARHVLVEHFIGRYKRRFTRPRRLRLDIDTTEDATHGQQELAFFNGHYATYCYRHLLIHTAEGDLLFDALLPGKGDIREVALAAYQLLAAWTMATDLPRVVKDAFEDAMELATANVPAVEGKVYVFPDTSGSMEVRRGRRLVTIDPQSSQPACELATPSALEWAMRPEKIDLPAEALERMQELVKAAPKPGARLRAAAKRHSRLPGPRHPRTRPCASRRPTPPRASAVACTLSTTTSLAMHSRTTRLESAAPTS